MAGRLGMLDNHVPLNGIMVRSGHVTEHTLKHALAVHIHFLDIALGSVLANLAKTGCLRRSPWLLLVLAIKTCKGGAST